MLTKLFAIVFTLTHLVFCISCIYWIIKTLAKIPANTRQWNEKHQLWSRTQQRKEAFIRFGWLIGLFIPLTLLVFRYSLIIFGMALYTIAAVSESSYTQMFNLSELFAIPQCMLLFFIPFYLPYYLLIKKSKTLYPTLTSLLLPWTSILIEPELISFVPHIATSLLIWYSYYTLFSLLLLQCNTQRAQQTQPITDQTSKPISKQV